MKYRYLTQVNRDPSKPHIRRSVVDLSLIGPLNTVKTIAIVDSGADYSLFNIEYARAIGIDLNKCTKDRTMGVEGSGKDVFLTNLEIQVENLGKINITAGFIDSKSVIGLLGQTDFFDLYRIKFERNHNTFEINSIK